VLTAKDAKFCGKSCAARFHYPELQPKLLASVKLKRQPGETEEQANWNQLLHNMSLGEGHAIIPCPVQLEVLDMSFQKHEGKWWDDNLDIDDGKI